VTGYIINLSRKLDIVKNTSLKKGNGMSNYITIHRDNHSRNFTVISNQIIRNQGLSYQARFLLVWLLSFNPQDGFRFSIDKISNKTGIPLSRTRSLIQELQNAGYIKLSRIRESNRYGCYRWEIFETPDLNNEASIETSEKTQHEEPTLISATDYNFNLIWEAYPAHRRGDRKDAMKAFTKIPDANDHINEILDGLHEMQGKQDWRKDEGKWIPGLEKFLTNRIWEEGLNKPTSAAAFKQKMMEAYNNVEI